MQLSPLQLTAFLQYAKDPDTWLLAARRQMAVARVLFSRWSTFTPFSSESIEERSGCISAAYFHAGTAVENAAKAHLVARDPTIIRADGSLDRKKLGERNGHGLVSLCESIFPSLSPTEYRLLAKLQEYVLWVGKYSLPINAATLHDEALMDAIRCSSPSEFRLIDSLFERLTNGHLSPSP